MTRCPTQRLVDRHFAGRIRPAEERRLRQHLPGCQTCTRYYERHRLLAVLDPSALPAEERLARGIGLAHPLRSWPATAFRPPMLLAAVAATAAAIGLLAVQRLDPADGFTARGAAIEEPRVRAYRVAAGSNPVELGETMAPGDELAFEYDNPGGRRYLLIFGVDEHRHVYWYHPAWVDLESTPAAVPISAGRQELPEAVAHELDGVELTLVAVFVDEMLTVREVEAGLEKRMAEAAWTRKIRVVR
jgi:hypothetical protein